MNKYLKIDSYMWDTMVFGMVSWHGLLNNAATGLDLLFEHFWVVGIT